MKKLLATVFIALFVVSLVSVGTAEARFYPPRFPPPVRAVVVQYGNTLGTCSSLPNNAFFLEDLNCPLEVDGKTNTKCFLHVSWWDRVAEGLSGSRFYGYTRVMSAGQTIESMPLACRGEIEVKNVRWSLIAFHLI